MATTEWRKLFHRFFFFIYLFVFTIYCRCLYRTPSSNKNLLPHYLNLCYCGYNSARLRQVLTNSNWLTPTLAEVFSCEFREVFKNTFFIEHIRSLLPDGSASVSLTFIFYLVGFVRAFLIIFIMKFLKKFYHN